MGKTHTRVFSVSSFEHGDFDSWEMHVDLVRLHERSQTQLPLFLINEARGEIEEVRDERVD